MVVCCLHCLPSDCLGWPALPVELLRGLRERRLRWVPWWNFLCWAKWC
jgi:hypothetical protein